MKERGFSHIQLIISISLLSIITTTLFSLLGTFFTLQGKAFPTSSDNNHLRSIEFIERYLLSTSIESGNLLSSFPTNQGLALLNLGSKYVSNLSINISPYINRGLTKSDSIYIEIPSVTTSSFVSFTNKFYIFRLKNIGTNKRGEISNLYFITGESSGSRNSLIKFGKEELIATKLINSSFQEERGGIYFDFTLENGEIFRELLIRRGGKN